MFPTHFRNCVIAERSVPSCRTSCSSRRRVGSWATISCASTATTRPAGVRGREDPPPVACSRPWAPARPPRETWASCARWAAWAPRQSAASRSWRKALTRTPARRTSLVTTLRATLPKDRHSMSAAAALRAALRPHRSRRSDADEAAGAVEGRARSTTSRMYVQSYILHTCAPKCVNSYLAPNPSLNLYLAPFLFPAGRRGGHRDHHVLQRRRACATHAPRGCRRGR
jgi:hypothetical protein